MQNVRPQHEDVTDDMWVQIDEIITTNRPVDGSVITVLRECQDIVGYLPIDLINYIGEGLGLPRSTVFGVATFYSLFSLQPKGRHTIKVCLGTACYVKGIKEVVDRIGREYQLEAGGTTEDRRFTLEAVRCLGACGLAPVAVVDDDIHGAVSAKQIINILEEYQ
jgi:NADH:ubiquinone oxidoreductase subunit E